MVAAHEYQICEIMPFLGGLPGIKTWPPLAGGFDVTDLAHNLLAKGLNERTITTWEGTAVMRECEQPFHSGAGRTIHDLNGDRRREGDHAS
jgi:hypothetical protein